MYVSMIVVEINLKVNGASYYLDESVQHNGLPRKPLDNVES